MNYLSFILEVQQLFVSQVLYHVTLTKQVAQCPVFLVDIAAVHAQLLWMQVSELFVRCSSPSEWLLHQVEVARLLWLLEKVHLLEVALDERRGYGVLSAELPHVDSQASDKNQRPVALMSNKGGMDQNQKPIVKDVVLIGGGHSHAYVIKHFGMNPLPGVRVILITNSVETPYSGMLPGHIAGHYTRAECHIDLVRLGKFGGARVVLGQVHNVDRVNHLVHLTSLDGTPRPPIPYDVLSINIGSSPSLLPARCDKSSIVTPVKPISSFSTRWDVIVDMARKSAAQGKQLTIAVVGAGAGGVELCLAMQHRLQRVMEDGGQKKELVRFHLFSKSKAICPAHGANVREVLSNILLKRGVNVHLGCQVVKVSDTQDVVTSDGRRYPVDECIWCTQASAQPWLKKSGFDVDDQGFIKVNDYLESTNTPGVFAAGDIACMVHQPRPKAGVFAVRQGPPLALNLRAALSFKERTPYEAQSVFLGIIGTGEAFAVASKGEMALQGAWLWALKDWIDRKWMAGYSSHLPMMDEASQIDDQSMFAKVAGEKALKKLGEVSMRCGGCGSKVGASVLSGVISKLDKPTRKEVLVGLGAPDDCSVLGFPRRKGETFDPTQDQVLVQSVDFFRSFIDDPYVFGKIIANHSISDCHAMGAEAVTALAVAVVPYGLESKVSDTLYQMMSGATDFMKEDGCVLSGGHTCEGAELSMGLSVTGVAENMGAIMRKGGMRAGDAIILTKPIGTGTLFAAHMRLKAKGVWVKAAFDSMTMSNKTSAQILRDHGSLSCTDVTGFGLIGHLVEMLKAERDAGSLVQGVIRPSDVPLLPGALECVRSGIFSSLQPQNIRLRRAVTNESQASKLETYPLLYDPQTAGGLLATVPVENAAAAVEDLRSAGYVHACVIGRVIAKARDGGGMVSIEC